MSDHDEVLYLERVPAVAQKAYQCGPAALASVLRRWGQEANAGEIGRALYAKGTRGVLNVALAQYARERGFWTELHEADPDALRSWLRQDIPPIVMLRVGPLGLPLYHFVILRGFNNQAQVWYANTGRAEPRAIRYPHFLARWRGAGYWTLIICPPDEVRWELPPDQAIELGWMLEGSGRFDLAERWYQAALADDPNSAPARLDLANVYLKTQRRSQAKDIYRHLVQEKPGWAPAGNNLAWIWLEEGRPDEAIRILEDTLRHGAPRRYDFLDTLGLAYSRLKKYPQARACLLEALENVPPDRADAGELIRAHLKQLSDRE